MDCTCPFGQGTAMRGISSRGCWCHLLLPFDRSTRSEWVGRWVWLAVKDLEEVWSWSYCLLKLRAQVLYKTKIFHYLSTWFASTLVVLQNLAVYQVLVDLPKLDLMTHGCILCSRKAFYAKLRYHGCGLGIISPRFIAECWVSSKRRQALLWMAVVSEMQMSKIQMAAAIIMHLLLHIQCHVWSCWQGNHGHLNCLPKLQGSVWRQHAPLWDLEVLPTYLQST